MKKIIVKLLSKSVSVLLIATMFISSFSVSVYAESVSEEDSSTENAVSESISEESDSNDPLIVVSLGDSYSSGEGNPPFYGQTDIANHQDNIHKVSDERWLAHRSKMSWPSLLKFPGMEEEKTLGDYDAGGYTVFGRGNGIVIGN